MTTVATGVYDHPSTRPASGLNSYAYTAVMFDVPIQNKEAQAGLLLRWGR
ncbi:hypothetical protein DEDE109153_01500 [Deinococcus deserti]